MTFEQFATLVQPSISTDLIQAALRACEAISPLAPDRMTPFYLQTSLKETPLETLSKILDTFQEWKQFEERRTYILTEIKKYTTLTPEIESQIQETTDAELLEDLFHANRVRPRSKASLAKEAGIGPLADWILGCIAGTETPQEGQTLLIWGFTFRNPAKGFETIEQVLQGAKDIIIEKLSDHFALRQSARKKIWESSLIQTTPGPKIKSDSRFKNYTAIAKPLTYFLTDAGANDFLHIRRGWIEEELLFSVLSDSIKNELLQDFRAFCGFESKCTDPDTLAVTEDAAKTALYSHVLPSIENDVLKTLKEKADALAVEPICARLDSLLHLPPFFGRSILAVDPGHRGQIHAVIVGADGMLLASQTLHLNEPASVASLEWLKASLTEHHVELCAVADGTALTNEAHAWLRRAVASFDLKNVPVIIANDVGSQTFASSEEGKKEFPNLETKMRTAVFIARRLQDSIEAFAQLDLRLVNLGPFQHDISPAWLKRKLDFVMAKVLHELGVDLKVASQEVLARLSGLDDVLAANIVSFRDEAVINTVDDLKKVPELKDSNFEMCHRYLRIAPADAESTVDPRGEFQPPLYRPDVFSLADLKVGEVYPGIVTHIESYGAFVDVGVYQDGLVHISQLTHAFVKDPTQFVKLGQLVEVKVLDVQASKKQFSLSIKATQEQAPRPAAPRRAFRRPPPNRPTQGAGKKRDTDKVRRAPKPAFNNPFSALAGLRDSLKK